MKKSNIEIVESLLYNALLNPTQEVLIAREKLIREYRGGCLDMNNSTNPLYSMLYNSTYTTTRAIVDVSPDEIREIIHILERDDAVSILGDKIYNTPSQNMLIIQPTAHLPSTGDIELDAQLDAMYNYFKASKNEVSSSTTLPSFSSKFEKWENKMRKKAIKIYNENVSELFAGFKARFLA